MVAVVCFTGAKVRYRSSDMLYAVLPTRSLVNPHQRANLMTSFCGWRLRKSKPAPSSISRSRPMMTLEGCSNCLRREKSCVLLSGFGRTWTWPGKDGGLLGHRGRVDLLGVV